jgi:hypothetical protein
MGVVGERHARGTAGWVGPGAVMDGAENLAATGFRRARSESLCRLSRRGPQATEVCPPVEEVRYWRNMMAGE